MIAALLVAVAGCNRGMLTPAAAGRINQNKLINLSVGMTKAEALAVMGTEPYEVATGPVARETILNPLKAETFIDDDGQLVEIIWYVSAEGHRIPMQQLRLSGTPLVFRSGKLIGWGENALARVRPSGGSPTP